MPDTPSQLRLQVGGAILTAGRSAAWEWRDYADSSPGFHKAILGMALMGERQVRVPPALAYLTAENPPVDKNSTIEYGGCV